MLEHTTIAEEPAQILSRLLIAAKVVKQPAVDEALKTAKRLDIDLSRALVMLKLTSDHALGNPIKAEALVRKGKLSFELAVKALVLASQNSIDLDDAINVMGAVVTKTQTVSGATNSLSELLLAARLLTPEQLGQALQASGESKLGLGRTLTINRLLSRWALAEALAVLSLVREAKIKKEQALNALKAAANRRVSVTQILFELGQFHECSGDSLKLSELVFLGGLIGESDFLECLEIEVTQDKPFGQIVIELGLLQSHTLEAACQLLDMLGSVLKPYQAAEALKQVRAKDITVYQAIAELHPPPQVAQRNLKLGDLVVEAGFVPKERLAACLSQSPEDKPVRIGKKLLADGLLSETALYASLRSYSLAKEGLMSADQAVQVLSICRAENLPLEEALHKFGINPPSRMQWSWI